MKLNDDLNSDDARLWIVKETEETKPFISSFQTDSSISSWRSCIFDLSSFCITWIDDIPSILQNSINIPLSPCQNISRSFCSKSNGFASNDEMRWLSCPFNSISLCHSFSWPFFFVFVSLSKGFGELLVSFLTKKRKHYCCSTCIRTHFVCPTWMREDSQSLICCCFLSHCMKGTVMSSWRISSQTWLTFTDTTRLFVLFSLFHERASVLLKSSLHFHQRLMLGHPCNIASSKSLNTLQEDDYTRQTSQNRTGGFSVIKSKACLSRSEQEQIRWLQWCILTKHLSMGHQCHPYFCRAWCYFRTRLASDKWIPWEEVSLDDQTQWK